MNDLVSEDWPEERKRRPGSGEKWGGRKGGKYNGMWENKQGSWNRNGMRVVVYRRK